MNSTPKSHPLKAGNEIVFTVTDYHDGPLQGIADYQGTPHYYECILDPAKGDYSELYRLIPLDEPTFLLAMEDWGIWRRWKQALHAGKTTMESHPALPEDASRHEELKRVLANALQSGPNAVIRIGRFSVLGHSEQPPGIMRPLQVQWIEPELV